MTKRLLIIEEAHNIVPNTEQKRVSGNIAMCSNHFISMLAEVAAYGTGLVIIDQRPTAVSPAVALGGEDIAVAAMDGQLSAAQIIRDVLQPLHGSVLPCGLQGL